MVAKAKKLKHLVIVESPGKIKTISKVLGKDYVVKASIGHIRDLAKSKKDRSERSVQASCPLRAARSLLAWRSVVSWVCSLAYNH